MNARAALVVDGREVEPGTKADIDLFVSRLPSGDDVSVPVRALCGARRGPSLWITAALHGDEVNGVEIVRRVLTRLDPHELAGDVIAVPVVNVFGFSEGSRYLPDRRDLNRCFPGSKRGSLGGRLAHLIMAEVVARAEYGIDLHTGSDRRVNLPQVRGNFEHPTTRAFGEAFGAPVVITAPVRRGSLRGEATRHGCHVIVYEAGEARRFDEGAIELGVAGVLRALVHVGMLEPDAVAHLGTELGAIAEADTRAPVFVRASRWVRAPEAGLWRAAVPLGSQVEAGELLGELNSPLGRTERALRSPATGVVIGMTTDPVVYRGDALIHLAAADA